MPTTRSPPTRPSLHLPSSSSSTFGSSRSYEPYSDSRTHGYQGPTRSVYLPGVSSPGGGAIAKSPDSKRCVVAGRESLRILRISESPLPQNADHKFVVGRGGHRIDASRNMWTGSGLKVDSAITDVAWGHKTYSNKLLTSARNGELIMWDLNKSGPSKYECRTKDHTRSINKISYSHIVVDYCISGSADGDLRVWDLRAMSKSVMWLRHPAAIRTVMISPCPSNSLHAISGLDNGSIYRWDLRVGQRGQLDRLPVAHSGPILALDWSNPHGVGGVGGGWLASAGLDRCVKVWDLSATSDPNPNAPNGNPGHIPAKPTYTLHASFPIRRIAWRPGYETELAIASNNEFGFQISSNPASTAATAASSVVESVGILNTLLARTSAIGSSAGNVDALNMSSRGNEALNITPGNAKGSGDTIEVWDVRRPYIAKWAVEGSCIEGGVTDMTFGDSHALWTHHPSGAFSQLDLRHSSKPIDLVPRVALTWDATGSITFVSDRKGRWEVPYDDTDIALNDGTSESKKKHKKLGDALRTPTSQNMGTCAYGSSESLQAFATTARGYRIEGADCKELCEINAGVAFDAGQYEAGQTWLLLQSLLTDLAAVQPPSLSKSPKPLAPGLPHSLSAPAAVPKLDRSPPKAQARSSSSEPPTAYKAVKVSPGRAVEGKPEIAPTPARTPNMLQRSTPTSPLSPSHPTFRIGPSPKTPGVRPKSRRQSSISILPMLGARRPSLQRASLSSPSIHSESPSDSNRSHVSLRHVGEGALDDSDSSDGNGSPEEQRSSDDGDAHSETTPLLPKPGIGHSLPSPLSKEDNDWAEDEREEDSVSPGSSETDSDDSSASTKPARSTSSKRRVRSRSSTIASLSASVGHRTLTKQDSHSSIRTVIAGEPSAAHDIPSGAGYERPNQKSSPLQQGKRRRSQAFSVASGLPSVSGRLSEPDASDDAEDTLDDAETRFLESGRDSIREAEEKYREAGWASLREGLKYYSDAGDVQMCAMLSCIAPRELKIKKWNALRFVEAYIDLLSRLRLHTAAAYLRKHAIFPDIQQSTQLQTTINTVCGKCRKPISQSVINTRGLGGHSQGGYSYCFKCKQSTVKCSICHLPVRTLLFVCPVCSHGGHQDCYRRFHMERPMTDLLISSPEGRGRSVTRETSFLRSSEDDGPHVDGGGLTVKVVGHPCAAGCGHYCWAANEKVGTE